MHPSGVTDTYVEKGSGMVWYLRDAQIRGLVTPEEANTVIEEVFLNQSNDQIVTRPTVELTLPRSMLRVKVGADFAHGVYGFKAYPAGGRYLIVLYDIETGLNAMVEGRQLTELRTGAVSAVGTKYMARPDASTLGIIGTGREARQQLISTSLVRKFETVWCYSRDREHRSTFAKEMSERLGLEVIAADSGRQCVEQADVVTTITNANEPVLMGEWLGEGTHINAVGATTPDRRELDDEAVGRCGTIVVELKEGAMNEVGELIHASEMGMLDWDQVHELHEVVSGMISGRRSASEITLNDTVGVGAEDVALAWFVVSKAREQGIGSELDFEPPYNLGPRGAAGGSRAS